MNEQIREIVQRHCNTILTLSDSDSISKTVKSIDQIVQQMYHDLYALKDIRYAYQPANSIESPKHGHCC